jgi:hypothetical protein
MLVITSALGKSTGRSLPIHPNERTSSLLPVISQEGHFRTHVPKGERSFDYLVGPSQQGKRKRDAERLCGFEIDDQLHLSDLLDR